MPRIRITIEVDTELPRYELNNFVRSCVSIWANGLGTIVYLATEIAPTHENRQRDILEDIT